MKTRIIAKNYVSDNVFWIAQVWERNFFKKWLTIGVASSHEKAQKLIEEYAEFNH